MEPGTDWVLERLLQLGVMIEVLVLMRAFIFEFKVEVGMVATVVMAVVAVTVGV